MKMNFFGWMKMKMSFATMVAYIVFLLLTPMGLAAQGIGTLSPWTFAHDYGQWSLVGQSANTYVFFGRSTCNQNAPQGTFFPSSTNAPIYIQDVGTPALSEVVTPSGIVMSGSTCGVTVNPANYHYSFQLHSGTAGLQEALNTIGTPSTRLAIVYLDNIWWAQAAQVPNTTPQAILYNAIGSAGVVVIDLTSSPSTVYQYQNGHYQTSGASTGSFNQNVSSLSQLSAPTALSTSAATNGLIATATTGGTIPATSTYRLAATYVDASGGETLISTDSASTATVTTGATATNTITVTSPAAATGAVGWRLYMTAAGGGSGSEILYTPSCTATTLQSVLPGVCAIGATATVAALTTGTATVPATATAYARATGSSFAYVPFSALGSVAAASTGTLGAINFPAGYFNAIGKSVTVCGNGNATTNSTPGTLTISDSFASVPGVTSIVPWSVTSGTTTASAVVPFNFCETITTAATGTTGTLEVHGCVNFDLAGTAVATQACDTIVAPSSAVDLTKADQLSIRIAPTTTSLTAAQLRQLSIVSAN